MRFSENLSENMNRTIGLLGYTTPTPIQTQAIPAILQKRDVIGQAQTGTGKTAAFAVPILESLDLNKRHVQVLVISPTRELAMQTTLAFRSLSKHLPMVRTLAIYGGQSIEKQFSMLRQGVQIVVGTPGRLMDHMRRGTLKLDRTTVVVLDEADVMLDMGFRNDIQAILEKTPEERQTLLFSATMPKEILDLARKYQKEPQHIRIEGREMTVQQVKQYYLEIAEGTKPAVLNLLIEKHDPQLTLVFCNTKHRVDKLVKVLQTKGHSAAGLHGGMSQNQRDNVMRRFHTKDVDVLVATDVAARGIDIKGIDTVINYDVPQTADFYVHRIGRTARAGREGKAFTLVGGTDRGMLRDIQNHTRARMLVEPNPLR
jgi:ATP-dependent RNA helicase DeaD